MTGPDMTEAACTGLTLHFARAGAEAAEAEATDILGPVRIDITQPEPPDITSDAGLLAPPPPPLTLTLTVTARRIHFATELQPLDARLLALAADMPDEQQSEVGSALAHIREAWRGGDFYPDVAEALQVIADNAAGLRELLGAEPDP